MEGWRTVREAMTKDRTKFLKRYEKEERASVTEL